jgi:hypothetical protein
MKNNTTIHKRRNRRSDPNRRQDLRAWCLPLECTEAEVRDTVRAVMRLMASPSWQQVWQ